MNIKYPKLFFAVGICLASGLIGSLFTSSAIPTWYVTLNKPFFSPPNWVFGPVWTVLYILMGISQYLIWNSKSKLKPRAMNFFWSRLGLNFIWSILFFGLRNPLLGLVDIAALWVMIILTIKKFYPISSKAAYLLVPYLFWVSFATLLNLSIVILN